MDYAWFKQLAHGDPVGNPALHGVDRHTRRNLLRSRNTFQQTNANNRNENFGLTRNPLPLSLSINPIHSGAQVTNENNMT